jgi:hypothetical protein
LCKVFILFGLGLDFACKVFYRNGLTFKVFKTNEFHGPFHCPKTKAPVNPGLCLFTAILAAWPISAAMTKWFVCREMRGLQVDLTPLLWITEADYGQACDWSCW